MSNQRTRVKNMKGEYADHMTIGEVAKLLGKDKKNLKRQITGGQFPAPEVTNAQGWKLYTPDQVRQINGMALKERNKRENETNFALALEERMRELFWTFVYRRQLVWHRRTVQQQPPPWTKDKVLQREFFTNMYRELDPATIFMVDNIISNPTASPREKLFNIMFYRFTGSQERTMAQVGFLKFNRFDHRQIMRGLEAFSTPFGDAYNVYPNVKYQGKSKIVNVALLFEEIMEEMKDNRLAHKILSSPTADVAFERISSVWGFGPFISYQVLLDCLYENHSGNQLLPFSRNDFVVCGPGARRGAKLLCPTVTGTQYEDLVRWLHQNQAKEFERYDLRFRWLRVEGQKRKLWLSDLQNALCEFQKYVRARKTGKATRKYRHANQT